MSIDHPAPRPTKPRWRKRLIWIAVACVILVPLGLFAWFVVMNVLYGLADPLRTQYTTSMEPVEHTISGHRFVIPMAFMPWAGNQSPGPEDETIQLTATMPDLAPYSEDTAKYYKGGKLLQETLDFSLWATPKGKEGGTSPFYDVMDKQFLNTCQPLSKDLKKCPHSDSLYVNDTDVFVMTYRGGDISFDCAKPGTNFNDFCATRIPVLDGIEMHVRVALKYFDQRTRVLDMMYDAVCGFHRPDPARPSKLNWCKE